MNIQQLLDAAEPVSRYLPTAGVDYINRLVKALRESTAREERLAEQVRLLTEQRDAVVAEMKSAFEKPQAYLTWHAIPPTWEDPLPCGEYLDVHDTDGHKNSDGTDCWPVYAKPETPVTSSAIDALREEAKSEVIEWLDAEISAIDPIYRGSPSYEHDAYWMKCRVHDLLEKSKNLFGQLRESKGAQS